MGPSRGGSASHHTAAEGPAPARAVVGLCRPCGPVDRAWRGQDGRAPGIWFPHALPYAINVGSPIEAMVVLLVWVSSVPPWGFESGQNGPSACLSAKWGESKANVVPVHHLMREVAEEVTVCGRLQEGSSER